MTIALKSLPTGIRDYLLLTAKLVLFMTGVAVVCGFAYGWLKGVQIWFALNLIIVLAQTWASRQDIADFMRSKDS
jgi:hypothetical protein